MRASEQRTPTYIGICSCAARLWGIQIFLSFSYYIRRDNLQTRKYISRPVANHQSIICDYTEMWQYTIYRQVHTNTLTAITAHCPCIIKYIMYISGPRAYGDLLRVLAPYMLIVYGSRFYSRIKISCRTVSVNVPHESSLLADAVSTHRCKIYYIVSTCRRLKYC